MDKDQIIVVQETEYTGAGKHVQPQLAFAKSNGIEVVFGDPADEVPGVNIVLPKDPSFIKVVDQDMTRLRKSLIKNAIAGGKVPTEADIEYLAKETNADVAFVKSALEELQ